MKAIQMAKIRVLCVDDNPQVIDAIKLALNSLPDIEFVGSLSGAQSLIESCETLSPNVVVLDIDMPGRDPFDAMREVTETRPSIRVIMYSGHVRQELIDKAIEYGAWGYVAKSDAFESLVGAIRKVVDGEFTLSQTAEAVYR